MIKKVLSLTKRRVALALVVMVLALSLSATAALAKAITCSGKSGTWGPVCIGTHSADTITGSNVVDWIYANGGSDTIYGKGGDDIIYGDTKYNASPGNDVLSAGPGDDKLYDESSITNDTYTGLLPPNYNGDNDAVRDSGGSGDVLNLNNYKKSQVSMFSQDIDGDQAPDSLLIEAQNGTGNSVLVRDYFDNSGGSGKGTGAIEAIKFLDQTVGFPAVPAN